MLCHRGPVQALAVDKGGHYMATSGLDGQLKIWDIRKFGVVQEYYTPRAASSLSISQRGLLAVGWGNHVTVWKDAFLTKQTAPYMDHLQPGSAIQDVHFVPYEDVLGAGHAKGVSSLVIPGKIDQIWIFFGSVFLLTTTEIGAGEPNFDSMEANPFQTLRQRQEAEVHSLLDKLQPDMIALNPNHVGRMTQLTKEEIIKKRREEQETEDEKYMRLKKKAKRHLRKQKNVVDAQRVRIFKELSGVDITITNNNVLGDAAGETGAGTRGTTAESREKPKAIYHIGHFRIIVTINKHILRTHATYYLLINRSSE